MSQVICSSCFEVEDTTKRFIELPYVCALCEKDSALAIEQDTYNSGVPCQSALDSVQEEQCLDPYCVGEIDPRVHAMDVLDQFDADTELIADLRAQLDESLAAIASLTEEIDFCDRRVRSYQILSAEVDKLAATLETEVAILKNRSDLKQVVIEFYCQEA